MSESDDYPNNTTRLANACLMLGQRLRRWANISSALVELYEFAV